MFFNTTENLYKKYVFLDPLAGAVTKTHLMLGAEIEEKLFDAPLSARESSWSSRFQRTTSTCQTWAKYPKSMCRPTYPTCLASLMTSCTVLIWAQALPPLRLVPFQNFPPSIQRSLSLSRQVSWELGWELAQGTPHSASFIAGAHAFIPDLEDGVLTASAPPPPPSPQTVVSTSQGARADDSSSSAPPSALVQGAPKEVADPSSGRTTLLESIRQAGGIGKTKLCSESESWRRKNRRSRKSPSHKPGWGDLFNKLVMRHKGISGKEPGTGASEGPGGAIARMSDSIPPLPPPQKPPEEEDEDE